MKKSIIGATALLVGVAAGAVITTTVPKVFSATKSALDKVKGAFHKEKEELAEAAQEVADELKDK